MRKLMWFTIGFAICCAAAAYHMIDSWIPPVVMMGLAGGIIEICLTKKKAFLRPVLMILAGCLVGTVWFGGFYFLRLQPLNALRGQELPLTITAVDYSYDTTYGTGVRGSVTIDGKRYSIQMYLNDKYALKPGDRASGTFRLRMTVPDEKTDSAYYAGNGIFLLASQTGEVSILPGEDSGIHYLPARLRLEILGILETAFPRDTAPFAKALLLGYTNDLDYETDTVLKLSGIRHIVAVSGLHVSILYSLICVLSARKRFLTAIFGIPAMLLFAAVAGFTPSVTRACVMVCLMMLAQIVDQEYDPPSALSFAVLVMLLLNPMAVTSVSMQLSSGCVAGILLFNEPVNSWMKGKLPEKKGIASKFRGMFCSGCSVTLSSMSLVTPLSAAYFGTVSLISVLTNLLTLWAVNLIFNGIIAACVCYLFSPGMAEVMASILSVPIRYVLTVAKVLGTVPLAAVYTESIFIVIWLVFLYILLAVFLTRKDGKPGGYLSLGVIGLCLALLLSWYRPWTADTQITMLDVGQGQSIVLQSEGKTFLVDCGGDREEAAADAAAEYLLNRGIHRLDGIILTHYDGDHAGGVRHLLTRIDTDYLFLPDTRNDFEVPETKGTVLYVWDDLQLTFGEASIRIFGPVYSGQDNENSLCVLFDTEKCDILITGDRSAFGERMLLRGRNVPDVDILVAGHHGAADAVSEDLLRAVTPETVLISVGADNRYRHPSKSVLDRLETFGCAVRRTDEEGTIIIRR